MFWISSLEYYLQVTLVLSSLLLAAVVSAYPAQGPESRAVILNQEKEVNYDGTFKNKYEIIIFTYYIFSSQSLNNYLKLEYRWTCL